MNHKLASLLTTAIVTGFIASSVARAQDGGDGGGDKTKHEKDACKGKNGCKGDKKDCKGKKDCCKGKKHKKHEDKAADKAPDAAPPAGQ